MSNSAFWICGRCSSHNASGVGVCQNPHCGGEPVSRSTDAVAKPYSPRPAFFDPKRQCTTAAGIPKIAYATFDEANDAVLAITQNKRDRVHAYRCKEHGWHVGANRAA